jgi:hypothetical protein
MSETNKKRTASYAELYSNLNTDSTQPQKKVAMSTTTVNNTTSTRTSTTSTTTTTNNSKAPVALLPITKKTVEQPKRANFKYSKFGMADVIIYTVSRIRDLGAYLRMVDNFQQLFCNFLDAHKFASDLLLPQDYVTELIIYIEYPFSIYLHVMPDDTFRLCKEDGPRSETVAGGFDNIHITNSTITHLRIDCFKLIAIIHSIKTKATLVNYSKIFNIFIKCGKMSLKIEKDLDKKRNNKISYEDMRKIKLTVDALRQYLPYYFDKSKLDINYPPTNN